MSLDFPLSNIRTFRFSLHTSHLCGAEIRNDFSLSVAPKFRPVPTLSSGAIVFPMEKMNQIQILLIPKTI